MIDRCQILPIAGLDSFCVYADLLVRLMGPKDAELTSSNECKSVEGRPLSKYLFNPRIGDSKKAQDVIAAE